MRTFRAALTVATLATALTLSTAGGAGATPGGAGATAGGDELRYRGGLSSPAEVTDSSPRGNTGLISTGTGGSITSATENGNRFLRFPGETCLTAPCPQMVISPRDPASPAPPDGGAGPFVFGADVRLLREASPEAGMNLFQHGTAVKGQSQWKTQVDYGHASCRWSDPANAILLPKDLHDPAFKLTVGSWYTIRCLRLPGDVFAAVLLKRGWPIPVAVALSTDVPLGAIVPAGKVLIGGKKIDPAKNDV
ncbi:MAG: hypothetical protein QOI35_616, partial [Cryptosporangiaceae bacterium]|nr:hypothetical protein [Cryptosporangiaceae bacterium]